jgi:repressor LexA
LPGRARELVLEVTAFMAEAVENRPAPLVPDPQGTTEISWSEISLIEDPDELRRHEALSLPMFGRISAGSPFPADPVEAPRGVQIPTEAFPKGMALEALRAYTAAGDTMRDMDIQDGDVLITAHRPANPGEAVIAVIDRDEVVVKRYFPHGTRIELRPANDAMSSRCYPANRVGIRAVIVGRWRPGGGL